MDWELRHWFFQRSSAPGPCSAGNMDPAVAQITACKLLLPSVQTTFPGVVKPSPARGPPADMETCPATATTAQPVLALALGTRTKCRRCLRPCSPHERQLGMTQIRGFSDIYKDHSSFFPFKKAVSLANFLFSTQIL